MSEADRIFKPTADMIVKAGCIIRAGGLVAFPTETVYGLGAVCNLGKCGGLYFCRQGTTEF